MQDIAASLPARLLGKGERHARSICAPRPAARRCSSPPPAGTSPRSTSRESRLARLRDNLDRTGLDAESRRRRRCSTGSPPQRADAVLLDAPCSATGIFRRHPDVLHRVRPSLIAEMAALQAQLLARAADWVKPGGTLVYATCSLEPPRARRSSTRFLAAQPRFRDRSGRAGRTARRASRPTPDGRVRTLPGMLADQGGCDGFFIARLRRTA